MTNVLCDTSAYSAHVRGHPPVVQALRRADRVVLTPIVLGELRAGFARGNRPVDNERSLIRFLESPRALILPLDAATSERYAIIFNTLRRQGTPISVNDVWIAATAMQHGLRLLTLDTDFRHVPQIIADIF